MHLDPHERINKMNFYKIVITKTKNGFLVERHEKIWDGTQVEAEVYELQNKSIYEESSTIKKILESQFGNLCDISIKQDICSAIRAPAEPGEERLARKRPRARATARERDAHRGAVPTGGATLIDHDRDITHEKRPNTDACGLPICALHVERATSGCQTCDDDAAREVAALRVRAEAAEARIAELEAEVASVRRENGMLIESLHQQDVETETHRCHHGNVDEACARTCAVCGHECRMHDDDPGPCARALCTCLRFSDTGLEIRTTDEGERDV